jgi:hypothetical protein
MSPQADFIVSNGTGAAVRSDLNVQFAAIVSNNSGATEPATMYAYQWWADTTTGLLKLRNSANSGWVTIRQLDGEFSTVPVENGTAAAPSIYFKDSGTDSGFFSPGTDAVAISTAGANRLHITSAGLVGIGNSSPAEAKLCVNGGISIEGVYSNYKANILTLDNNAGNSRLNSFGPNITTPGSFDFVGYSSNASVGTTRMFISSAGLVGVGTSSPGGKLDVRDAGTTIPALGAVGTGLNVRRTDGAIGLIIGYENAVGGSYIQAQHTNGSATAYPLYLQPNGGNVGIGSTSPSQKLEIGGAGRSTVVVGSTDSYAELSLVGATTENYITSDDALAFYINSLERLRMDTSGRLLVGTPSAFGTASNNSFYSLIQIKGNSNSSTADGRLTIGTGAATASVTSSTELGRIVFTDGSGADYAYVQGFADGTAGTGDYPSRIVFATTADGAGAPTEQMRIDNAGNLKFNSGYGSAATAYGCRAWVNFNGTGTVAIRASGNVSSITDNGTGDYTVNFTTAMPDANYSAVASGGGDFIDVRLAYLNASYSTAAHRFSITNNSTAVDATFVNVAIFR